jgi:hypothetical protein
MTAWCNSQACTLHYGPDRYEWSVIVAR